MFREDIFIYFVEYALFVFSAQKINVYLFMTDWFVQFWLVVYVMQFVEYSKMIYLDGDIQVFENIDHLFDLPDGHFYAVMDCFCEKTWSKTPQYKIGYCQQCPDRVRWPAEMGEPPALYFNAGMFMFEPSISTYHDLLETVKVSPPTTFAEQDFLNMYFKHIYKPIPLVYNLVLAMLWRHPENVELDKVKVVHYCAAVCVYYSFKIKLNLLILMPYISNGLVVLGANSLYICMNI